MGDYVNYWTKDGYKQHSTYKYLIENKVTMEEIEFGLAASKLLIKSIEKPLPDEIRIFNDHEYILKQRLAELEGKK